MTEEVKTHNTGETPAIPMPIVVPRESRISLWTKFFVWATGLALAVSVLVALVTVVFDRNDLRSQLSCRAAASFNVNKAIINEQIALADHSVLIGKFIIVLIRTPNDDPNRNVIFEQVASQIEVVDKTLDNIGHELRDAVTQQQVALSSC